MRCAQAALQTRAHARIDIALRARREIFRPFIASTRSSSGAGFWAAVTTKLRELAPVVHIGYYYPSRNEFNNHTTCVIFFTDDLIDLHVQSWTNQSILVQQIGRDVERNETTNKKNILGV